MTFHPGTRHASIATNVSTAETTRYTIGSVGLTMRKAPTIPAAIGVRPLALSDYEQRE